MSEKEASSSLGWVKSSALTTGSARRPFSQSGSGSGSCGAHQSTETGVEGVQSQRLDVDVCQSTKTGIRKQSTRSLLTVH